jgi:hypothetical protein
MKYVSARIRNAKEGRIDLITGTGYPYQTTVGQKIESITVNNDTVYVYCENYKIIEIDLKTGRMCNR